MYAHFPSCSAGPDKFPAGFQGLANPSPTKGSFGVESKLVDGGYRMHMMLLCCSPEGAQRPGWQLLTVLL